MASKFVIREKGSQSYCTSGKQLSFDTDLNEAVLFASHANAEKVVRDANKFFTKEVSPYGGNTWSLVQEDGTRQEYFGSFMKEYLALLNDTGRLHLIAQAERLLATGVERKVDLEVVEVRLTLV